MIALMLLHFNCQQNYKILVHFCTVTFAVTLNYKLLGNYF